MPIQRTLTYQVIDENDQSNPVTIQPNTDLLNNGQVITGNQGSNVPNDATTAYDAVKNALEAKGYVISSKSSTVPTIVGPDNTALTIYVTHKTINVSTPDQWPSTSTDADKVSLSKTITRTITVEGLPTAVEGTTQTVTFTRTAVVDEVTGKDLIIFFGGYNDRGVADGEIGDIYPTNNTMCGRIQYCINKLYQLLQSANNLTCRIIVITPHCAGKYEWNNVDGYGEYPSGSGYTMHTMASAIEKTCRENSIPCLNLWETSGINKNTWSVYSASETPTNTDGHSGGTFPYNNDQLHLNVNVGYPYLGQLIAKFIETI